MQVYCASVLASQKFNLWFQCSIDERREGANKEESGKNGPVSWPNGFDAGHRVKTAFNMKWIFAFDWNWFVF